MTGTARLDALFSPRAIAVVGASANPKSIGGQPVAILREAGYKGAVKLGVSSLAGLKAATLEVVANARRYHAGARIDGLLIAEMARGAEVISGVINDKFFGPTVMSGMGGVVAADALAVLRS